MSNSKNLKPVRTTEEARKRGANGGRKSGETRRRQKTFREIAKAIMPAVVESEEMKGIAKAFGVEEEISIKLMAVLGIVRAACAGDVKAFNKLTELIGEQSTEENGILEKLIEGLKDE